MVPLRGGPFEGASPGEEVTSFRKFLTKTFLRKVLGVVLWGRTYSPVGWSPGVVPFCRLARFRRATFRRYVLWSRIYSRRVVPWGRTYAQPVGCRPAVVPTLANLDDSLPLEGPDGIGYRTLAYSEHARYLAAGAVREHGTLSVVLNPGEEQEEHRPPRGHPGAVAARHEGARHLRETCPLGEPGGGRSRGATPSPHGPRPPSA